MPETFADVRRQITSLAADAFEDHAIRVVEDAPKAKLYRCGRQGSSAYAFYVALLPGAVVFYGDLGEAILRPSDSDVLPWLRGAVYSLDYLVSKVKPQPEREFYKADARAWVDGQENLGPYGHDKLSAAIDDGPDVFARELSDMAMLDGRVPGMGLSSSMLWMAEALKWFVAHVDGVAQLRQTPQLPAEVRA